MGDVSQPSPHDPLRAFLFRVEGGHQYALTSDPEGRNIPRDGRGRAGWTFVRPLDLVAGEHRTGFDADEAARSLRQDGYALIGSLFGTD
jgi:hypothetical protein